MSSGNTHTHEYHPIKTYLKALKVAVTEHQYYLAVKDSQVSVGIIHKENLFFFKSTIWINHFSMVEVINY